MAKKRKDPQLERFFEFIRTGYCAVCFQCDYVDQFGNPRVTVSHIKTKGSGGGDFNNVVPMCFRCHRKWEDSEKSNKLEMLAMAKELTDMFLKGDDHEKL